MTRAKAIQKLAEILAPNLANASEFSRDVYFTWATDIVDGVKFIPYGNKNEANKIVAILDKYDPAPIHIKKR